MLYFPAFTSEVPDNQRNVMSSYRLKRLSLSLEEFYATTVGVPDAPRHFDISAASFGNKCGSCQSIFLLQPCRECDSVEFDAGRQAHVYGIYCHRCGTGKNKWNCANCRAENLTNNTFGAVEEKSLLRKLLIDPVISRLRNILKR